MKEERIRQFSQQRCSLVFIDANHAPFV